MTGLRAHAAHRHRGRVGFGSTALRISIGAIFLASAIAIPQIALPAAAEASSCTGWTSRLSPPETIRVLRSGTGRVEVVDFRRYVAEVMASGEWPSRLRSATLEAGAVATKQYAWYYALKGHHREHYRRDGQCYDVRDDTTDQLYRPAQAEPTPKQQRAVERTWGLTLRKSGRFFLTGYRAGVSGTCAADANGWKLYARSAEACARQGWSRQRIQRAYLDPNLAFVWSNRLGPVLDRPELALRPGTSMASGAVTVSWTPASSRSDVKRYQLQRKVGNRAWRDVSLPTLKARTATVKVKMGVPNRFRVMARDDEGHRGPWSYSPRRKPAIRGPVGLTLSSSRAAASGSPGVAKATFVGRAAAFMTETGPGMGRARILVGGKRVATVDLHRDKTTRRALVWARNWPNARRHTVTVKPVDKGTRVDFEGFFILR